ncbi:hypothetical protein [Caldimonas brevitalea]|uniref:Uncharacterized protein n=1 Tax=Caldimonas brevitalea TaxID=413882 RepID=A0A0G3BGC9_9BURK|nr:hypothetical protein [Caldimonas brevitalea]AKJ28362.1 hypothetical protein AAW51_1671 [Caldimonas brevitalea]
MAATTGKTYPTHLLRRYSRVEIAYVYQLAGLERRQRLRLAEELARVRRRLAQRDAALVHLVLENMRLAVHAEGATSLDVCGSTESIDVPLHRG